MTPCTQEQLDALYKKRDSLIQVMTSGIQEIEQPQLGRTQYRSLADIGLALRAINDQINACLGVEGQLKTRRPIYPVVREI